MEALKYKLLIVDDNTKNIQVLANTLSTEDYEIEHATNGKDALTWVNSEDFDLILLDVMMPEIDGFNVCTEIKKIPGKALIPIIFITAKTDVDSITKGFHTGGIDYITKPFNEPELLARVKTHLELKKHRDGLEELVALRTEQLHKAHEELEVLDQAKDEFLNMLSHEIRTPLNGVMGFLGVLKARIESAELQGYLSLLDMSAKRLEEFSLKALRITSFRSGKFNVDMQLTNLGRFLADEVDTYKADTGTHKIAINISIPREEVVLALDRKLFSIVIKEIVKNVAMHASGADKLYINIYNDNNRTVVSFRDNGKGFSDKALNSLFIPFGTGQKHVNEKIGLGLHLVKLAMKIQKFDVHANNHDKGGAALYLLL